jgi:hypothetical protein
MELGPGPGGLQGFVGSNLAAGRRPNIYDLGARSNVDPGCITRFEALGHSTRSGATPGVAAPGAVAAPEAAAAAAGEVSGAGCAKRSSSSATDTLTGGLALFLFAIHVMNFCETAAPCWSAPPTGHPSVCGSILPGVSPSTVWVFSVVRLDWVPGRATTSCGAL